MHIIVCVIGQIINHTRKTLRLSLNAWNFKWQRYPVLLIMLVACLFAVESSSASGHTNYQSSYLFLADTHFDPFVTCRKNGQKPCPLIAALESAPIEEWGALLASASNNRITFFTDTDYLLFKQTLEAAARAIKEQQVDAVFVVGDHLAHQFRSNYRKYSTHFNQAHFSAFVNKTMRFIEAQLRLHFANNIYMVLGNNDSDIDDYSVTINGHFLETTATHEAMLVHNDKIQNSIKQQFKHAGNYAITLPEQPKLKLIVFNSVLLSTKATTSLQTGQAAMAWLQEQLEKATSAHQKIILLMHIPQGIDFYLTPSLKVGRVRTLWKKPFITSFETLLSKYSNQVVMISYGHLHSDYLHYETLNERSKPILLNGVPAISTIFATHPGFKICRFDQNALKFMQCDTYKSGFKQPLVWKKQEILL